MALQYTGLVGISTGIGTCLGTCAGTRALTGVDGDTDEGAGAGGEGEVADILATHPVSVSFYLMSF